MGLNIKNDELYAVEGVLFFLAEMQWVYDAYTKNMVEWQSVKKNQPLWNL